MLSFILGVLAPDHALYLADHPPIARRPTAKDRSTDAGVCYPKMVPVGGFDRIALTFEVADEGPV